MAEDSVLNHIVSEFKLWGVKFQQRYSDGGHIELAWQVSPDKPLRQTFLPKTGSDWRSWLNQRAQVRRMFQADGLSLKKRPKEEPKIVKALALPKESPEKPEDQLRAVRAEMVDLTNMVLELGTIISGMRDAIEARIPAEVPVPQFRMNIGAISIEDAVPVKKTRAPSTKGIRTIDYVSANWNSLDAIARDMAVSAVVAKRKLVYLAKSGAVELSGDRWRRTPKPEIAPPKKIAGVLHRKRNGIRHANGHGRH